MKARSDLERVQQELEKHQRQVNAVQMELDLHMNEHRHVVEGLRKQISTFESQPPQEVTIHGLQEQLKEMDALLSMKNQEIEDNDDRVMGFVVLPEFVLYVNLSLQAHEGEEEIGGQG